MKDLIDDWPPVDLQEEVLVLVTSDEGEGVDEDAALSLYCCW
jgi:hypothetical protein